MIQKIINIAEEFSDAPGGRNKDDGPNSGEEFREKFLIPAMNDENFSKIIVNFDGAYGYATSFLEEAFGGLSRLYGVDIVLKKFVFVSNEEPNLINEVTRYIREGV